MQHPTVCLPECLRAIPAWFYLVFSFALVCEERTEPAASVMRRTGKWHQLSAFLLIGILGVHPIPVVELGSYRIVEGNLVGIHLVIAVVALFGTFCGRVIFLFLFCASSRSLVFIHGVEVGYFIQQDIRAIDGLLAKHLYAAGVGSREMVASASVAVYEALEATSE